MEKAVADKRLHNEAKSMPKKLNKTNTANC